MAVPFYDFYKSVYYGNVIPMEHWDRIALRANEWVSRFERIYTVTDPTEDGSGRKMAVCAIADALYTNEVAVSAILSDDGVVGAVSIGSVSTSFKTPDVSAMGLNLSEAGQSKQYYSIMRRFLDVNRGVRSGN